MGWQQSVWVLGLVGISIIVIDSYLLSIDYINKFVLLAPHMHPISLYNLVSLSVLCDL